MEKGYSGGVALARDVARMVALYVKTHPQVVEALEERQWIEKHFDQEYRRIKAFNSFPTEWRLQCILHCYH